MFDRICQVLLTCCHKTSTDQVYLKLNGVNGTMDHILWFLAGIFHLTVSYSNMNISANCEGYWPNFIPDSNIGIIENYPKDVAVTTGAKFMPSFPKFSFESQNINFCVPWLS